MVEISPFRGITYNKNKIQQLDNVVSPPYDIISTKMQEELYEKNPHNYIRLILGKENDDDDEKNNRYTRAKEQFDKWFKESVLIELEICEPYSIIFVYKNWLPKDSSLFNYIKKQIKFH